MEENTNTETINTKQYKAEFYLDLSIQVNKNNRYAGREDDFQITCSTIMDIYESKLKTNLNWFHVANERKTKVQFNANGKAFTAGGNLMKAKGVKRGVPDLWIMKPCGKYHGLIIELKTKYNKPSEWQHEWLDRLNKEGYLAVWVNSIDELTLVMDHYFEPYNQKDNVNI